MDDFRKENEGIDKLLPNCPLYKNNHPLLDISYKKRWLNENRI